MPTKDRRGDGLAASHIDKMWEHRVHVEEVPESQFMHTDNKLPPGFTFPDPDDMDQGDRLFILLIGRQSKVISAM